MIFQLFLLNSSTQNFFYQISKDDADEGAAAVPLEMANVAGVFYVLCGGEIFALIFAFIVVLFVTMKLSKEIKVCFYKRKKNIQKFDCPKKKFFVEFNSLD